MSQASFQDYLLRPFVLKHSSWANVRSKFARDRYGLFALGLVFIFFLIALAAWTGLAGSHWQELLNEEGYGPVSRDFWFGANFNGQDIFARCIFSTKTAFEVGFVVAFFSTCIGVVLGGLAGFYQGKWVDQVIIWSYGCFDAIPFYLFVAAIALTLKDSLFGMHLAMIATLWTPTCKVLRAQVMKLRAFEFVEAAYALGASDRRVLFRHILPNTIPIILVEFTLSFVTAIKTEAVLSFLGLGIKDGVSWGLMLAEASSEIQAGYLNNFIAASSFMFVLVMAFNQFADALQEALDPQAGAR